MRRAGVLVSSGLVAATGVGTIPMIAEPASAIGATILVDDASDGAATPGRCVDLTPNDCTLRDAIAAASPGDTITFAPGITHITLTAGGLIAPPLTITGPGSHSLTIDSTAPPGAFDLFRFNGTGDVVLTGVTLVGQRVVTTTLGGFIVDDVAISDSTAYSGAAVLAANRGDVTISHSRFVGNTSQLWGGALEITGSVSDFSLLDSVVSGNHAGIGGGVSCLAAGSTTIADSVIASNHADGGGGGAYARAYGGNVSILRSTFADNVADANGGGFYFCGADGTSLSIIDSIFLTNSATGLRAGGSHGGGIFSAVVDTMTIANSTVSGNSAPTGSGGGLYVGARAHSVRLLQDTIATNSAPDSGGVSISGGTLGLSGTILSANTATADPATADVGGQRSPFTYQFGTLESDHSLVGEVAPPLTFVDLGGTIRSRTPGLGAPADNGGGTLTMALLPESPAIDAGPVSVAPFVGDGFDQRGRPWRRTFGDRVDIGAYELQPDPNATRPAFTG